MADERTCRQAAIGQRGGWGRERTGAKTRDREHKAQRAGVAGWSFYLPHTHVAYLAAAGDGRR